MLSVLCVTKADPYALFFLQAFANLAGSLPEAELVIAADGPNALQVLAESSIADAVIVPVQSQGYIESVLDQAVSACRGDYVLRLDDDEKVSLEMAEWLRSGRYRSALHWKFPRAHLWGNAHTVLMNAPLWPDHQTRLSVKAQAGGRPGIHSGSPFGGGRLAPVALLHAKFIVKTYEERRAIAETYDRVMPGGGTGGFLAFNLPEDGGLAGGVLELRPLSGIDAIAQADARVS